MGDPVAYWKSDRDYYPRNDPRRAEHLARIETRERINRRIAASAGDGSYAVVVRAEDMA